MAVPVVRAHLAEALERLAWADVATTLLDPAALQEGLAAAQAEYTQGNRRRTEQLAALDRDIIARRARLSRILDDQLDAPPGSERARTFADKARQLEQELETLQADRAQRAAAPHVGLSDEQIESLVEFAALVRSGLTVSSAAERRHVCTLLGLQGTLRLDDARGYRLSRFHGFEVEWAGNIPIRCSDREFVNIQTVWMSDAGGTTVKSTSE